MYQSKIDLKESQFERKLDQINGKEAVLNIENGRLVSIDFGKKDKINISEGNFDYRKQEQLDEKSNISLYDLCKDILEEMEAESFRPVFSVPRKFAESVITEGLSPKSTWIKEVKVLAGTIGRDYYNEEGDRILCVLKPEINFKKYNIRPRLTGAQRSIFQGIIATDQTISPEDLIFVDTKSMKVIDQENSGNENMGKVIDIREKIGQKLKKIAGE